MNFLKKIFNKNKKVEFSDEEYENHYELKKDALENVLGEMGDVVGHAIIPFEIGGAVDMYYFPNGIEGTGFATMELIKPDGSGSIPNTNGTYELVAFTKEKYVRSTNENAPFNLIERRFCRILTNIGNYSFQAKLSPYETCELPQENEDNICLIFDEYKPNNKEFNIGESKHSLLLVIEIYRDEMDFARSNGTKNLIEKLKLKGHYPYSDLNRESVLN